MPRKKKAPGLFDDGTPPSKPSAPVQQAIDLFHDRFVDRFGFKPDPRKYGRFAKEIKALIATWGEDEVLAIIREFFTTTDYRVAKSDYSASAFLALAQHLRLRLATGKRIDERTQENIDAAARATGRR